MTTSRKVLKELLIQIIDIKAGIAKGEIKFTSDKLLSALGAGHPSIILGSIIDEMYYDVINDNWPSRDEIDELGERLCNFRNTFCIDELDDPIDELDKLYDVYDAEFETGDNTIDVFLMNAIEVYASKGYIKPESIKAINNVVKEFCEPVCEFIITTWQNKELTAENYYRMVVDGIFIGAAINSICKKTNDKDEIREALNDMLVNDTFRLPLMSALDVSEDEEKLNTFYNDILDIVDYNLFKLNLDMDNFDEDMEEINKIKEPLCKTAYYVGVHMENQNKGE